MAAAGAKRKQMKIGTHNGSFHCDEALGCFLLKKTEAFKDADIVRSRDPKVLDELDVVIDVGGVYEPANNRFDHHQKGFTEVFGHGFQTKLSSAGLVYKHFGQEILAKELGLVTEDAKLQTTYLKVYQQFMEGIDGIDNGVNQWDVGDAPPRYVVKTDLSSRVGSLNPRWDVDDTPELYDSQFAKAMALAGADFMEAVDYIGRCWLPARQYVQESLEGRFAVHPSGEIMVLGRFCPWKEHLFELEALEEGGKPLPKYCLYADQSKAWRVQAIPLNPTSFASRKALPEAWRGLRDEELSKVSGVPGCVFVHMAGFIGGNATREGALEMASKALTL